MMLMVMVVLIVGHLVKLNMEARLAGRRGQLPEVSTVYFYCHYDGVADVNHIPVISTIDGDCENLSLGSAAKY